MTWAIKNSVNSALKERELEVTTGKAMQDALTKLRASPLNSEEADAAALVLASMGKLSIMFLISEYKSGTVEATIAVEKALFVLGLTHQPELCACLRTVIGDKGQRFRIETYRLAAIQIGKAQCQKSVKELRDFKNLLRDPSLYSGHFSVEPTLKQVQDLREEVDNALNRLAP